MRTVKGTPQSYSAERLAKKNKALEIMGQFTTKCDQCQASSSQVKLFDLEEGLFCLNCLPEGMSGLEALDINNARRAKLKEERDIPVRPEEFGEWA